MAVETPLVQIDPAQSLGALVHATTEHATTGCLDLAVVIPTYNERENIARVLESLAKVLTGISYEAIVVDDDSPDIIPARSIHRRFFPWQIRFTAPLTGVLYNRLSIDSQAAQTAQYAQTL